MTGERVLRRLAAIMAADVVGYSRLMGRDENGTLVQLGASTLTGGVSTQSTTISVSAGETILLWVYGFNFAQGLYDLNLGMNQAI